MQQLSASAGEVWDKFCGFVEKDNRMTEFGLYGLSSAALLYAYIRKRPFTKFTSPSQIPKHFIEEKVLQTGVVRKIQPTEKGPLLLVNHAPPINLPFSQRALPIRVAGVQIDGNGYSWLQILATNRTVKFYPVSNSGTECQAKVILVQPNKKDIDVARALVGLGFARTAPLTQEIDLKMNPGFVGYHKQLKSSESKARSRRKGLWSSVPESFVRWYLRTQLEKIVYNLKPLEKKLPPLVR